MNVVYDLKKLSMNFLTKSNDLNPENVIGNCT